MKWSILVAVVLFGVVMFAEAQQPAKVRRIGYLSAAIGPSPAFEAFRQGMRETGYVEGQNLSIDFRASETSNQLVALATELIQQGVEVIVAQGPVVLRARLANASIPIVFGFSGDPVEAGLVQSLARPGGNLTGMSFLALELASKRLELLKEITPKVSRIAIVTNRSHPGEQSEFKETQTAAQNLKISLSAHPVSASAEFKGAYDAILKERSQAVLTFPDAVTLANRASMAEFALKQRLPTMFGWKEYVDAGGLASYGPNLIEAFRRLAVYVDKILKGTKPSDLPIERPIKFEFVINLKTAKQIGLEIPQWTLMKADRVIK
jgi:putative ABC transport system substrate-binding protein